MENVRGTNWSTPLHYSLLLLITLKVIYIQRLVGLTACSN